MTRVSQTDLAVLAVLDAEPMTGYALRETITGELGAFWAESFGQIYPALGRLLDRGDLAASPAERAGSSRFELTEQGRARLLELLLEPAIPEAPRNGVLLRLFFGRALGPDRCADLLARARDAALARLDALAAVRAEAERDDPAHRAYRLITVSAGEHAARAAAAWADESLAALAGIARD